MNSCETFEACKKAAIEQIDFDSWLWKRVTQDSGAVVYHGAVTWRVAVLAGQNDALTRRKLWALHRSGKLLISQHRKGAPIRWWPVGLFDELQKRGADAIAEAMIAEAAPKGTP